MDRCFCKSAKYIKISPAKIMVIDQTFAICKKLGVNRSISFTLRIGGRYSQKVARIAFFYPEAYQFNHLIRSRVNARTTLYLDYLRKRKRSTHRGGVTHISIFWEAVSLGISPISSGDQSNSVLAY